MPEECFQALHSRYKEQLLDRWEKVIPADQMLGEWARIGHIRAIAGVVDYPPFRALSTVINLARVNEELGSLMTYCFLAGAVWMADGKLPKEFYSAGVKKAFREMFSEPEK